MNVPLQSWIAMLGLLTACSSGGSAGGDACARASASCPGISITSCTPTIECQAECALDHGCAANEGFSACVRERCTLGGPDAGRDGGAPSSDTRTSADDPPPRYDSGPSGSDSGTSGTDSSSGGGWGCSADSPNGCTCANGVTDDGKGCSTSRLAAPGVCCSNGSRCRCESILCTSDSAGCSCMVTGLPSKSTSCSGPLCCAFPASSSAGVGYCACYYKPGTGGCAALGGTTVSSCGASNVPCYYKDEHSVTSCE